MMNASSFYRSFTKLLLLLLVSLPATVGLAQNSLPQRKPRDAPRQYTLTSEELAKARAYARARHLLYFTGQAVLLGVLLAVARVRRRLPQSRWIVPLILLVLLFAQLPLDAYQESLSRFYGQSIQGWDSWLVDELKGWAIALLIGTLVIWGVYALIRRSPNWWWLHAWFCSVPLQLAAVFLSPLVIEPMFYRFQPLEKNHPALVRDVERILKRAGVDLPRDRLYEMKASEKTNSLNAYVSGFGASKRLVLWDTIIAKEEGPPLLTTVGHELGHYVLNHIRDGLLFSFALTLVGLFLLHFFTKHLILGNRLPQWDMVPWLLVVVCVLAFLGMPLTNGFSRMQEHEADLYALEVTHEIVPQAGKAAAEAFQIEGESALADPDPGPFIEFWLYDHPPLAGRLKFSLDYDPWREGLPPKYVP